MSGLTLVNLYDKLKVEIKVRSDKYESGTIF